MAFARSIPLAPDQANERTSQGASHNRVTCDGATGESAPSQGGPSESMRNDSKSGESRPSGSARRARRPRSPPTALQRALGLLSRREHSRKELIAKLQHRGIEGTEAESAVERLMQEGWQDNDRFACSLARMRVNHGYGPIRIRAELATHDITEEQASAALDDVLNDRDDAWRDIAHSLVVRRYGDVSERVHDPGLRRRAADFLIRRGFDVDAVRHAMRGGVD